MAFRKQTKKQNVQDAILDLYIIDITIKYVNDYY